MKPILILIAPNKNIADVANQIIKQNGFNCRVVVGNLDQGVKLARISEETGVEAIISRGGTFLAIQQVIKNLPLIEIHVSAFDLLEALYQASSYKNNSNTKIGLVGYPNTIYGAASMGKYLNLDIIEIPVENQVQLKTRLMEEVKKGMEVIAGDTISVLTAQEIGIKGVLISSGKRAIFEALERAEELVMLRRKESIAQARFRVIIDEFPEGILVLDSSLNITHSNSTIEKYTGLPASSIIGNPLQKIIPGYQLGEELITLARQQYLAHSKQITYTGNREVGHIITLKHVKQIQETEARLRKKLHCSGLIARYKFSDIIGKSEQILKTVEKAKKLARSDATLLISGNTGTGKEIFAQSIHNASLRSNGPFVAVNCAAFTESLLESELFGYAEGSFTDARKGGKPGLFELAHGGTIFLDEIGDMSLSVQAKVLRVLQEKQVIRVGDDRIIPVDIRIIAATNNNLWEAVKEKKFREDLYYRVNVLKLYIPPLKEREYDVILLAEHFFNKKNLPIKLEDNCFNPLLTYDWPGNVRELYNFIEQLAALSTGQSIQEKDVKELLKLFITPRVWDQNKAYHTNKLSDELILQTLKKCGGNQSHAAHILGIDRSTLWRRLKKIKIPEGI